MYRNFGKGKCTGIGGPGKIVEIDESKFGKRKYHRGRRVDEQWVFGGIEREWKNSSFACDVDDRSAATLIPIILRWIKPGTTIISDCWNAYSSLGHNGYTHLTVNHSLNFVDPTTGAHTNTIESTWRTLKSSLPKSGTEKHLYTSYFVEYALRKRFLNSANDKFLKFLDLVSAIYNPNPDHPNLPAHPSSLP